MLENGPLAVVENFTAQECSCKAGIVAQGVSSRAVGHQLYVDDAMATIHAHIATLYRNIDNTARRVATDDIIARLQCKGLTIAKLIFNDCDITIRRIELFTIHLFNLVD